MANPLFADSLTVKVDSLFVKWNKPDSPGCALAIIKDHEMIYARGYGSANLEYNLPITSKSVFRIGSTSKQFTAMCILLLAEQGKLALDDDIRKHVPEMPDYGTLITISHLIHHTSGIRDYLTLMELAGLRNDDFLIDDEVIDLIARQKELNFKPGDEYLYSNSGYFLLSVIVKRASGKSLREFADEHIFKPLGMAYTHFHDDHRMVVKNRASGYSPKKDGGFRINMTTLDMVGDGGVFTTVEDMAKWERNFYQNKLGRSGQDLIDKMLVQGVLNSGDTLDYASALVISDYKGLKMVSHGGAFVGFRAEMVRFPGQKFSVICLANLSAFQPSQLARQVADIYLKDQFAPGVQKEMAETTKPPQFVELSSADLQKCVGTYRNPANGRILKIFFENGELTLDAGGENQFHIRPESDTAFRTFEAPVKLHIIFEKQTPGKPDLMHVRRAGRQPSTYQAIKVWIPAQTLLDECAGAYFSDELRATYHVVVKDGGLYLVHENPHKNYPKEALEPTLQDMFYVAGIEVKFTRNAQAQLSGLTLNTGRVKNIQFVKK
ncbi:MAG: serine hydrolase domain-containing protein [bacterium]